MLGKVSSLHAAVWEGNVDHVRQLLQDAAAATENNGACDSGASGDSPLQKLLEAKDPHGNTPLHLALRVVQPAQRAIVQLLLEYDANVASRNNNGWSCVHDATLLDDEYLLAQVYLRGEIQLWAKVEERQEAIFQALENLADFEVEIFLEARSWVPMVSSILPSDTIHIWKRGSQLRCDSELKGLDGVKWNRGRMSHLYMGRHSERAGHAVIIDHESKSFYDASSALEDAGVAKIDLALQLLLTTSLAATSMDSSKMEFIKRKEGKVVKMQHKYRDTSWVGTQYKIQNFSVAAHFRPAVTPDRKLLNLPSDIMNETLETIQGYVNHLSLHSSNQKKRAKGSKSKSMRNIHFDSTNNLTDETSQQVQGISEPTKKTKNETKSDSKHDDKKILRLEKGKKTEMHLDVCAGDLIKWNFITKSKDFSFVATYYHADQKTVVCKSDGVKNVAIIGEFEAEHQGSFVLTWMNTQKSFSIDRSGIKILYDIAHIRPVADHLVGGSSSNNTIVQEPTTSNADNDQENDSDETDAKQLTDEELCKIFHRLDHIPNPMTTTTAFSDYFRVQADKNENEDASKLQSTNKLSLFKRNPERKRNESTDRPPIEFEEEQALPDGQRNTFRSMTTLPKTKHLHKDFEAKLVMVDTFPFQLRDFLPVIQFLANTGEHMKNLEEFFKMKLPPGFPVKFELPMMFTVRIAYTFQKITLNPEIPASMFDIPRDYQQVYTLKEVRG